MPLTACTLTGVDEVTPLVELAVVSDLYPYAEWGFLYLPEQQGRPGRFPSVERMRRAFRELPPYVQIALHVCGSGAAQLLDGEPVIGGLVEQIRGRRGRVQLNVDVVGRPIDLARLRRFMQAQPDLIFITPFNEANAGVLPALAGLPNHSILFDDSLGRGVLPASWRPAMKEVDCGYAGGLGPDSLDEQLPRIYAASGGAPFWIDMAGRLRDAYDRFSMHFVRQCLEIVDFQASERNDFPARRPLRRRCEPIQLIDSGLLHSEAEADFETMLRRMIAATRNVIDPEVMEVRRQAEDLLLRRGSTGAAPAPLYPERALLAAQRRPGALT